MKNIFIGIDFSKATIDVAMIDSRHGQGKMETKTRHRKFSNNDEGYRKCLAWVEKLTGERPSEEWLFCGEDTGRYSLGMSEFLHERGLFMWLEMALRVQRSLGLVRGKSDKADAIRLADYAMRHQDRAVRYEPLSIPVSSLKELFLYRLKLVEQRKALAVRARSCKDFSRGTDAESFVADSTATLIATLDREIRECEDKMKEIIDQNPELSSTFESVTSIKGVALINAVAFIVYTNNFRSFGGNPRKIATYWGVAVFGKQSGTSVHRAPRVSSLASRMLKALISEAARCAVRHEPRIAAYYQRLLARGKPTRLALNNVKNKLIRIITSMAIQGTMYNCGNEGQRSLRIA